MHSTHMSVGVLAVCKYVWFSADTGHQPQRAAVPLCAAVAEAHLRAACRPARVPVCQVRHQPVHLLPLISMPSATCSLHLNICGDKGTLCWQRLPLLTAV